MNEVHFPLDHQLGATTLRYSRCPRAGVIEWSCFPTALSPRLVAQRESDSGPHIEGLPSRWKPVYSHEPEWLVQYKLEGTPEPGGHQAGRSLRGSDDLQGLAFDRQEVQHSNRQVLIITHLKHSRGYVLKHVVRWSEGDPFFRVHTEFENSSSEKLTLEYFPSFSLGGITPFDPDEATERLYLHRFRATWSAEGRHEALPLESLNLDRSWVGHGRRIERFGQIGSMPVRQFFPWVGLEDRGSGVMWGVQLATPGSWHLECSRRKDKVNLSGGLPSRDYGAWWKSVAPQESFISPEVVVACVEGELDDLCEALTSSQVEACATFPAIETELPMVFNEWCSSWGNPNHRYVMDTAEALVKTHTKILVIDDGWAAKPEGRDIQCNGDWVVDLHKFPKGFKPLCDELRQKGLIPGLWFEFEASVSGTKSFDLHDRHLHYHGKVLQVGKRHFWDLRDPLTQDWLAEKVLARLKDDGFGYLKIDYNEVIPEGVDGDDSPGEGLRQHLLAVQNFLRRIQREVPEIIIENCSSGGHRLEPSFQAICPMGSFSDAHETVSIPIIAANLHRLILPRQSQVWCVVHGTDTVKRLRYGLSSTFLGRMAISGDVRGLSVNQLGELVEAQEFYLKARSIIRDGHSRVHQHIGLSWNKPKGWQAVIRQFNNNFLVVCHSFGDSDHKLEMDLKKCDLRLEASYGDFSDFSLKGSILELHMPEFSGSAFIFSPL